MKSVLVIEDDLLIQDLLLALLEEEGYRVLLAEDGREAVRLALEHRPDLILSDLSLPGMSGFEVASRLRDSGLTLVAVTAHCRPDDLLKIQAAGFHGYLSKPVNPATFVRDLLVQVESSRVISAEE